MTTAPLVEGRALVKRWHPGTDREVVALDGVSLAVAPGAFVAITGPSGGGKTTLLSILAALDRPTSGQVRFEGRDLSDASDAERSRVRRRVGFVFQASPMIRGLPVGESVTYPLIPLGIAGPARRAKAAALLARVGLSSMIDKRPEELSGGELQRVGIARALVGDPALVVADEPTSNLDRRSAEAVTALLREIHAGGTAVLVATHDPQLVAAATETHEIDGGKMTS